MKVAFKDETSDRFINSVRAGPRGGAPLILLHAVSLDLTYWDAQFARLSKTHDVLAFDWPGHGRSSGFAGGISFDDLSEVVASVVKEAASGPAHIVGLSMGSMVAQSFALTHPELIQSLCLIGSTCTSSDPVRQALREEVLTEEPWQALIVALSYGPLLPLPLGQQRQTSRPQRRAILSKQARIDRLRPTA